MGGWGGLIVVEWEPVDFVIAGVGSVETNVNPAALDVDAFGFKADGVEVDGLDFAAGGEVDDVQPVVAGAVAVGQEGETILDFAALCHFDTVDGDGLEHIAVGEPDKGVGECGEPEFFEVHGATFASAIGIEVVAVGVEAPVLSNGKEVGVVEDALDDGGACVGESGDETGFVTVAAGDVEEGEWVAVGTQGGEGGVVAMSLVVV